MRVDPHGNHALVGGLDLACTGLWGGFRLKWPGRAARGAIPLSPMGSGPQLPKGVGSHHRNHPHPRHPGLPGEQTCRPRWGHGGRQYPARTRKEERTQSRQQRQLPRPDPVREEGAITGQARPAWETRQALNPLETKHASQTAFTARAPIKCCRADSPARPSQATRLAPWPRWRCETEFPELLAPFLSRRTACPVAAFGRINTCCG